MYTTRSRPDYRDIRILNWWLDNLLLGPIYSQFLSNRKNGMTYFDPVVPNWNFRYLPLEAQAKANCNYLFFVISNEARSAASMVEVRGQGSGVRGQSCLTISNRQLTLGLFTKEGITFPKPFRITILFLIGFVLWTMCVHKHCNRHH